MLDYLKIEEAVRAEENASGFAELMKKFVALGVINYDYFTEKGIYRYYDADSHSDLKMNGVPKKIVGHGNRKKIKQAVKSAQSGIINFEEFCELAGLAGIASWNTDLVERQVVYKDSSGKAILIEPIK